MLIKIIVISFLFCSKQSSQKNIKKRTKETPRSPLFAGVTARFARAYARRKNVLVTPGACVCVCVSKLFGLTKDKVQKDAKNREILCSTSFT